MTTVLIPGGAAAADVAEAPRSIAIMSDRERRVISKLAIPWSVRGLTHRLWIDQYTVNRSEFEVHEELLALQAKGWCVNLGSRATSAKVVHAAQNHPLTIPFPDENADIYARRMALPERAYRCEGDTWMLTVEGWLALAQPTVESPPVTPSRLSEVIASEFSRVSWDYDGNDPANASRLHPDVYRAWLADVVLHCERTWGTRPRIPIAGGAGSFTDVWENYVLDHENQKTSLATNDAIATPWYMPLSIVAYSDTDTGATHGDGTHVPTYTGYQAKDVPAASMNAASAGSSTNNAAITYNACTAGSSTVVAAGNNSVQANTSGIFRKWFDVASTTISTTQTPAQFAASAYTTTVS